MEAPSPPGCVWSCCLGQITRSAKGKCAVASFGSVKGFPSSDSCAAVMHLPTKAQRQKWVTKRWNVDAAVFC